MDTVNNIPISYNIKGAVAASGLSRSAVYLAIKSGALKTFHTGTRHMILRSELEKYILGCAAGGAS